METFPLYGDSSLWRLFLCTRTLLYGDFSSLPGLYGDSSTGDWACTANPFGIFWQEIYILKLGHLPLDHRPWGCQLHQHLSAPPFAAVLGVCPSTLPNESSKSLMGPCMLWSHGHRSAVGECIGNASSPKINTNMYEYESTCSVLARHRSLGIALLTTCAQRMQFRI